jgi:hypothetical protein
MRENQYPSPSVQSDESKPLILHPILHHLNADSSWLLQIPRPNRVNTASESNRCFFNILIDPWLRGPQSDVARWFSQQWHEEESKLGTIAEVESLAWQVEDSSPETNSGAQSIIDAIAISHEFTDHCHRETLLEAARSVPVFASSKAATLIQSWKHFDTVVQMPDFNALNNDWRTLFRDLLPSWLSISRVMDEKDALYYHSAIMIAWTTGLGESVNTHMSSVQSVLYTPHGITPEAIAQLTKTSPPIQTLCLIHGLHDVSLKMTQQLNLGAHNGLKIQRSLKPKYWFGTHDEVKKAGGVIKLILRRKIITVEEAIKKGKESVKPHEGNLDEAIFEYIGNGEHRILK